MLVQRIVASVGGLGQAPGQVGVQIGDPRGLGEGIARPDAIREEKLHHRAEDLFLLLGSGDCLQRDLAPFEELDQANALDVLSPEPLVYS